MMSLGGHEYLFQIIALLPADARISASPSPARERLPRAISSIDRKCLMRRVDRMHLERDVGRAFERAVSAFSEAMTSSGVPT
jgi:hypothetical protein